LPIRPLLRLQIGLGFSVVFLSFFLYFAKGAQFKALLTSMLVGGVVLAAVYAGVIAPSYDHDTKVSVLGGLAVAFNVVMYAAPISQLVRAAAAQPQQPAQAIGGWRASHMPSAQ